MTIASATSRISYTGDGATTAFAVPFYFAANADLVVYLQDSSGNLTLQVFGTHYTLTGATLAAGGTCTFVTAPTATTGAVVSIYRDPPITQTASYNNNDPFPAKSHETALDKLTTIEQRTRDLANRAIHITDSESASTVTTLATVASRKNKLLGFGSSGEITYPLGPTFVGGTFVGVAVVDSRATAQVTTFAVSVNVVRTSGLVTPGDGGGADYIRGLVGDPGAFQDGGGVYWKTATFGVADVESRATAALKKYPSTTSVLVTSGLVTPGDGGGRNYVHGTISSAGAFQDASGQYWGTADTGSTTQTILELFRHPSTGAAGTSSTVYAFPGSALSASTIQFYAHLNMQLKSARWSIAWTPGHATNTCKIRLIHADSGPTNITEIAEFVRASATPVTDASDVTVALRGLLEAGVIKTLGHQVAGNGVEAPIIYLSVIECLWGTPTNFLIPAMTSATTPAGYTASASTTLDASSPAWKAFDKGMANYPTSTWISAAATTTGWLRIDAPSAITPSSYWIIPRNSAPTQTPKDWTLEGSNDGSSWTVVDTRSGITGWSTFINNTRAFAISSPQAFSKWRLNITAVDGSASISVTEFDLIG